MIEYRVAKRSDLIQVARIHKEQFKDHYLGQFSISFLEAFYENLWVARYVFIVAEDDGKVLGFVLGGEWGKISDSLTVFMKKNMFYGMIESFVRPKTWKNSLQKLFSLLNPRVRDPHNLDNIEKYTLLSIAICKSSQGKGIGKGLVNEFNNVMEKFTNRYYLSVQNTNERAIGFYKRMGFVEEHKFNREIQMIKTL